ncbi:DUF6443 domain-containing protein [Chitinophaga silvisoli]|uniref:DUF6443 domain-containing protein n=1 Tax=Chitinophaga silvisoli TaxID=2291814 RepID=UPI001314613A|nr:DUF6443 domain-containing protein [Chitinophaga silvisoli]
MTTWEPNMPISDTMSVVSKSRIIREVRQSTTYYDGLGRVKQSVAKGLTFGGRDLVYPVVYDAFGRQQYMYMSYAQTTDNTNDGKFKTDPFGAQETFFKNANLNPETANESIFYRKVEYELSPLGKILKNYSPGNSWSTHGTETKQLANTAADSVRIWNLINEVPVSPGIYAPGELLKEVYIDEQQNQTVVYKDKQGQLVLKKVLQSTINTAHAGWLCTYYVYNDADMLSFVIPPAATNYTMINKWSNIADVAKELCYHYVYDDRNRRIIEEVPGKGALYKVFDLRDRLVFTQDAEQRTKSPMEWYTVLYDGQNRTVMTAIYKSNSTREALQAAMNTATASTTMSYQSPLDANLALYYDDGSANYYATQLIEFLPGFESNTGTEFGAEIVSGTGNTNTMMSSYSLPGIAMSALTPLIYMYYDDYNYPGVLKFKSDEFSKLSAADTLYPETFSGNYSTLTKYLPTGMKVRVLGTDKWLTTTTYYNDKGRPIQLVSGNSVGGKDILTMLYSFNGNLLTSYLRHQHPKSPTSETRLLTTNSYDHTGRLVSIKKRLNDESRFDRTIATYSYDELGRINKKRLGIIGNGQPVDSLLMTYNVRGWLKSINKEFVQTNSSTKNWFGEDLSYDYGFNVNYNNGNIAGQKWKSRSDGIPRAYGYTYDATGRLAGADFSQQDVAGAAWGVAKMDFSVSNLAYDANGGMQSMIQQGMNGTAKETMDNLTYKYFDNSNKLRTVTDANTKSSTTLGDFINGTNGGDDYTYNLNGNLTSDENRNISSISYNYLNLPEVITVKGKGTITYQYDALGNKLRKTVVDNSNITAVTTVTDYAGGFIYQNDSLQTVEHEEGRIRPLYITNKPVSYAFDYFEKDHLGNIRLVLTDQPDSSVYAASMEVENAVVEAATFSNIEETRVAAPAGYSPADTTINNKYVAKLNGKTEGNEKGPAIVLRVMAGDTVMIKANAFYKSQGPTDNSDKTPSSMIADALQSITGSVAAGGVHSAAGINNTDVATNLSNNDYRQLKTKDTENPDINRPKAYLNYVLFDDQFNMVDQNSGMKQVQAMPDEVQQLAVDKAVMQKAGFLYVYTDNETAQDVYFDNVQVMVLNGPVLEETHYYPFGLTMEAISYNALKGMRYAENKFKFNGIESNRDLGLNQYDAFYRNYDPQIGRWMQVDPKPNESTSSYSGMANNPVLLSDFLGDTTIVGLLSLPETVVYARIHQNVAQLRDQLINHWATLSGLNLTWDSKTSRIVNQGIRTNRNISMQARKDIMDAVDGPGKIYIGFTEGQTGTIIPDWKEVIDPMVNVIVLNPQEIEDMVNGTSPDLDPMTFGIGMTALHELGHTFLYGKFVHANITKTEFNHLDQVDVRMNIIRAELGKKFGTRTSYASITFGTKSYLPMSQSALEILKAAIRDEKVNAKWPYSKQLVLPSKGVIIFPEHQPIK